MKKVFLIWLMIPTITLADTLDAIPKPDKVLILQLGQKAPYSGVLMNEDQFRYFKTQELEAETLSKAFANSSSESAWPKLILPFILGLSMGVLADRVIK